MRRIMLFVVIVLLCIGKGYAADPNPRTRGMPESKVTKDNYAKIKMGMTVAEVEEVIGRWQGKEDLGPSALRIWYSPTKEYVILVSFREGKAFTQMLMHFPD